MRRQNVFVIVGIALMLVGGFCAVRAFLTTYAPRAKLSETVEFTPVTATPVITPVPELGGEEPTPEPTATPYISPVDFAQLRSVNPDIYAWIDIDNTNISYPVLQDPSDNTFYLTHNSDGAYSANGSIYSEDYNTTDFSDPVTVLYGHHMKSGAMFGNLQQDFSNPEFFQENDIIRIYTENELLEYGVFAAVPYSGEHLLYEHDFSDDSTFETFFRDVFNIRSLECQFRQEYAPTAGDRVLILSTCLASDNTRRFLVMATLLP